MAKSNEYLKLCEEWVKAHKQNPDNFCIQAKTIQHDKYTSSTFYFVYNKAFARPFVNDSPISEMIYASDFAFKAYDYGNLIVERDTRGTLSGRHGTAYALQFDLEAISKPKSKPIEFNNESKDLGNVAEAIEQAINSLNGSNNWPWGQP